MRAQKTHNNIKYPKENSCKNNTQEHSWAEKEHTASQLYQVQILSGDSLSSN